MGCPVLEEREEALGPVVDKVWIALHFACAEYYWTVFIVNVISEGRTPVGILQDDTADMCFDMPLDRISHSSYWLL